MGVGSVDVDQELANTGKTKKGLYNLLKKLYNMNRTVGGGVWESTGMESCWW